MTLKPGVSLKGVRWQMFEAAVRVEGCYEKLGLECVITSGTDGQHIKGSLHYKGLALDFRKRTVPVAMRPKLLKAIRQALGPDYDVLEESDHVHVELDPE
jgi:hypothetical protein